MKQSIIIFILSLLWACKKDKDTYGIPNIYMPQALNVSGGISANYPVPTGTDSSTYNYAIDAAAKKLNIILGVAQSSTNKSEGYTVNIVTDADTINLLKFNNILDANTLLMPAGLYTLPAAVNVPAGKSEGNFLLSLDIDQLKSSDYEGKKLALAVRLQSAGKYAIAANAAVTIVIVDVDALVIGPSKDISSQYLKNTSTPFTVAGMHSGGRWGTLTDWIANTAAKSHDGYGGYASDEGGTIDMESGWGSPAIHNGKIWQTTSSALPAGTYTLDVSNLDWQGTKDPTYIVVAPGLDTIPDYGDINGNTTIHYTLFSAPKITFTLTEERKVTVGFAVNYVQDQQGFKIYSVKLLNYPKHL
ncbi:DUF5013 domain-containing protein [Chitinophaga sp.]|uniref:DUF5013 domain-containing protein n=1 Tax=Chitinophaga sp. TaxID=1869181 RepID=UPI0031DEE5EF